MTFDKWAAGFYGQYLIEGETYDANMIRNKATGVAWNAAIDAVLELKALRDAYLPDEKLISDIKALKTNR